MAIKFESAQEREKRLNKGSPALRKANVSVEKAEKALDNIMREIQKIEMAGEKKAWGVRIDSALHDLIRRNSKNQTADAEEMILEYVKRKGWK